jgi:hypothetical protein
MIRTTRLSVIALPMLAAVWWFAAAGCSSSNEPSTNPGSGGSNSAGTGGTSGSTGTGVGTTGSGGTSGSAGTGAGTGGAGGGGNENFSPLCAGLMTAAGVVPAKGGACTAADPQLCFGTCGPSSIGFKSETCTGGVYAEQAGCSFKKGQDYSCYKIPATIDPSCPAAAPQASQACEVAACTPCNAGGNYLDSGGASKAGFCVCPAASGSGMRKWTCASTTAWPCPNEQGC